MHLHGSIHRDPFTGIHSQGAIHRGLQGSVIPMDTHGSVCTEPSTKTHSHGSAWTHPHGSTLIHAHRSIPTDPFPQIHPYRVIHMDPHTHKPIHMNPSMWIHPCRPIHMGPSAQIHQPGSIHTNYPHESICSTLWCVRVTGIKLCSETSVSYPCLSK